jgi:hypothetical protein
MRDSASVTNGSSNLEGNSDLVHLAIMRYHLKRTREINVSERRTCVWQTSDPPCCFSVLTLQDSK